MNAHAAPALTFTGERFTPEVRGAIWYEHWHRYCAASHLVADKRVVDAACGEGYGSLLLARSARSVVGIDIGAQAVEHARERYRMPNLRFECASVTTLPLPDASVDVVVSFETIEHLAPQEQMLAEFRRVLAPDGVLVMSSPNRPVYNPEGSTANEYHVRELDRAELRALLDAHFPAQRWYGQRVMASSVIWQESAAAGEVAFDRLEADVARHSDTPAAAMYFVVVCGGAAVELPRLPAISLFDDGELSLWSDYVRASTREKQLAWDELDARKVAEDRLAALVIATNALASERERSAALAAQRAALMAEVERVNGQLAVRGDELRQALATLERAQVESQAMRDAYQETRRELASERAAHGETRARLEFRETAVGWLRWPLSVARRRLGGAH